MPGIVVWTHNGKPPSEGGKRIGYLCGLQFTPIGHPTVTLVPPPPPKPDIVFYDLPETTQSGFCRSCRPLVRLTPSMRRTDVGERKVYECAKCGTLMRYNPNAY